MSSPPYQFFYRFPLPSLSFLCPYSPSSCSSFVSHVSLRLLPSHRSIGKVLQLSGRKQWRRQRPSARPATNARPVTGAALHDGQPVGRRISSVAFAFDTPLPQVVDPENMDDNMFGAGSVKFNLTVEKDAALNPFIHQYHPDHDNYDPRYNEQLDDGRESFSFTRALTLTFEASDPEGLNLPGWGDTLLGGTYQETLSGVHRQDIYTSGTFRLHLLCTFLHVLRENSIKIDGLKIQYRESSTINQV